MTRVYLDHAATSPPTPAAREAASRELPFGNPSSVHREGRAARAVLDDARAMLAAALAVEADEIVFTGSGTEADNLALRGIAWAQDSRPHLVTSAIEHDAVRRTARWLERRGMADVTIVGVGADGRVAPDHVAAALRPGTALASIMAVNNEVGTVQDVAAIGRACASQGVAFHVDAVQAPGRIPVDVRGWGAGLVTLSPHKVGGPKGIGVLVVRRGLKLHPVLTGGAQESGLRPGTENVALALGAAVALVDALEYVERRSARLAELTRRLEDGLLALPDARIHGAPLGRAPGIVSASFGSLEAVTLVQALDLQGFAVSSGSACSSGSVRPSAVLEAMGLPPSACRGGLRFSLSPDTTEQEIDSLLGALPTVLDALQHAG